MFKVFMAIFAAFIFFGCEDAPSSGPAELHWDRDMCDRCVMVISDRKNAVQLHSPKSKKVFKFDDIGCMVLWFKEGNEEYRKDAKIWITDAATGKWIDATKAFYTAGNITPMGFGFSAYALKDSIDKKADILTYEEVVKKIQ